MLRDLAILPVTAAAGLIAGGSSSAFLAAALAAASAIWFGRVCAAATPALYASLDPQKPDGSILLVAFQEALDLVRRTQRPIRLRLTAFAKTQASAFSLDLNREGDPELASGARKTALKQPGVWLPDHPLPLVLPRTRSLTLLFETCGPTRIRVSPNDGSALRKGAWLGLAFLAVTACALDTDWMLSAVLGFAFQIYLLEQQTRCAPNNARVKCG